MPLRTGERLWESPGPEQSAPGAPRLLIVYPLRDSTTDGGVMRYAGRVEPADAVVTLDGKPLRLYPGGIFTGLRPLGSGSSETWRFKATSPGGTTAVERTVRRPEKPVPAPAWPLAFYRSPVSPSGSVWMRPGETLKVTLYASPGQRAQVRIGPGGAWKNMTEGPRDPDRGGVYRIELPAPLPLAAPRLQTVSFRITGGSGGTRQTRDLDSSLRVATIPAGKQLWGRVSASVATFLKNGAPADWARWGNWIRGTVFPVAEGRGGRLRVAFDRGEGGWVENELVTLDDNYQRRSLPALGAPKVSVERQALTLAWPAVKLPPACVFHPDPTGTALRVSLPGAASLKKISLTLSQGGFAGVQCVPASGKTAPSITVRLSRPLWGYAMTCDDAGGLRIVVRTRPRVGEAGRPLAGLRVMLDAGHGGPGSLGERGPSGLLEKDINLVQAAWLERDLEALGAEVRQARRGDDDVDLDARVDMALAWTPDLFISLHHNSVPYGEDPLSDSGPIVFYHYAHSQSLARTIAGVMAPRLDPEHGPRVRPAVFRVIRNESLCPAVLVESAYICNPFDELGLRNTENLKASAAAIAEGVRQALEN